MLALAILISATSFLYVNWSNGDASSPKDKNALFQESTNESPNAVLPDTERIKKLIQLVQQLMPQQRI